MLDSIKKFVLWNYERGTWQYDVFCLLIIAFIFLTPKTWFEKREKLATHTAHLIVKDVAFPLENNSLERPVRQMSETKTPKF
jgi:hypothetical protein